MDRPTYEVVAGTCYLRNTPVIALSWRGMPSVLRPYIIVQLPPIQRSAQIKSWQRQWEASANDSNICGYGWPAVRP